MFAKKIVILANSIKHGEHCVAGKCTTTGQWIRPVSTAGGEALTHTQVMCRNPHGLFIAKPLQKVIIQLDSAAPLKHQPENYLVAANSEWQQDYKVDEHALPGLLDDPISLWGQDNRVSYAAISQSNHKTEASLFLVQTEKLHLYVNSENKRRVQFYYKGIAYDLPATDPQFDSIVNEGRKNLGVICISLGEEFNGYCYKIAAAIY